MNQAKAQVQTKIANQRTEEAEHLSYVANLNFAVREFEANNYPRGYDLLNSYFPTEKAKDCREFSWYLLWKSQHNEWRTLTGHEASVVSVTWSEDGKTLASGSWDKTIKLWVAATEAEVREHTPPDQWSQRVLGRKGKEARGSGDKRMGR